MCPINFERLFSNVEYSHTTVTTLCGIVHEYTIDQLPQWRRYRGGGEGAAAPPRHPFCYVWRACAPSGEYTHNLQNYANILYWPFTSR